MKRFLWLGLALSLYLVITGCGDTFRPIIIPNPPVFPNPAAAHTVVSINDNGTIVAGSAMVVDVSGDTDVSVANVGLAPVHAVQQTASVILVANHSVTGVVSDSITKLNFSSTTIAATSTISLPANSAPNFVAVAPSATTAYVSLPGYAPPSVGVVDTGTNSLVNTITVGSNPDAIAVTPNNTKVYVANQGDSTVDGFTVNTVNLTPRVINGSFNAPLWLSPRSDSQRVYVLNGNGVVSTIDTTSTAGPDSVIDASINVPGAAYMLYDGNLNRLYIPWFSQSAAQGQLTMLDVSQSTPVVLTGSPIAIAPVPASTRAQSDVCSAFTPSAVTPAAVASLPDGSRAYVGSYASFEVDVTISTPTSSNGVDTTYTYNLKPGTPDLLPGMVITISGATPSDFNGTFVILSVGGGTFEVANAPTDTYVGGGTGAAPNICPQVTVVNTVSNSVETSIAIPGFAAYNAFCSPAQSTRAPRFRLTMAAGGDSSRAYLASCDGGAVNIIDTSSESYVLNLAAPVGTLPPIPPNPQNPPQNPVFLLAGP
jgi:DNA-binding beta-propeller fold protein YncE